MNQFVLGRGELKTPKFALLLAAGFLIVIPAISAQDAAQAVVSDESAAAEDQPGTPEFTYTFDDTPASPMAVQGPSVWIVIRMVLVLALVAASIYGALYFIKRVSKPAQNQDPFLKVLASSHLGSNRYVHIVAVGSSAYLLGAAEGGVNIISKIEDNDIVNAMLLEDSKKNAESAQAPDFLSILRRLGASVKGNAVPTADENRANLIRTDFIRKSRERLKGL